MAVARIIFNAVAFSAFASAAGNLQLFLAPEGAGESIVSASIQLASIGVGDEQLTRFRIRNTGDAAATLSSLRVAGIGFRMTGQPSLPHMVAPGMNVDFTVHFRPQDHGSFSANLLVNSTGYLLVGAATPAVSVLYNGQALVSGDTIDFGAVERGSERKVSLIYKNTLNQGVGVTRATLSGPSFSFSAAPPTPYLEPGTSAAFEIIFKPAEAGIFTSTLTIDRRDFRLVGTSMEPTIPRPVVVIETPAIRSGEQGRVTVRFAERSRARTRGKLTMELRPAGAVRDNDTAARFISGGGRSIEFQVTEGQLTAGTDEGFTFQAGTTAGTIVFTVETGGFTEQASVAVSPEAVRIDKSAAVRTASGIDVQLSGFDNTRTASDLSFTFYSKSGQPLPGMPVKLSVAREFERWWQESKLGGIFLFRASFPVTGDASQIAAVETAIVNASGKTDIQRMSF